MVPVGFSTVPGRFFIIPGGFSTVPCPCFTIPGIFFTVPCIFLSFQVGFYDSMLVFMVAIGWFIFELSARGAK